MKTLTIQLILSATLAGLGLLMVAGMIYVESEPGGIPLLVLAVGSVWHVVTRRRAAAAPE